MQPNWQKLLFISPSKDEILALKDQRNLTLDNIALLILDSQFLKAETALLAQLNNNKKDTLLLLAFLDLKTRNFARLNRLMPSLVDNYQKDPFLRALIIFWYLLNGTISQLDIPLPLFWNDETNCTYLALAHCHWLIEKRSYHECQQIINNLLVHNSLDTKIIEAKILTTQRQYAKTIELLIPWRPYSYGNQEYWRLFLNAHFQLEQGRDLDLYIRQALDEIPIREELNHLYAWGCLLNKKPALGRYSLLKQRLLGWNLLDATSIAHLYNTHEMLGQTENLIHILPQLKSNPIEYLDVYSNLLIHLTSLENPQVQEVSQQLMQGISCTPGFDKHSPSKVFPSIKQNKKRNLRIAWITGDCRYHPVARFLLGALFKSAGNFTHNHLLVSTKNLEDKIPDLFSDIKGLDFYDFSEHKAHNLTNSIRALDADIAIDLSGWTHGNAAASFIARIASVQVNYLGYFGTTGIPSMDWWLGDSNLFPTKMNQWHSEKLLRLPRCFIAWTPHPALPEAEAHIPEAPKGPIRFGCFNHLRKLSDSTLRAWSSILSAIPDSRLVLKAPGFQDPMTIALFKRRILRANIDLERIDFLPFSSTVSEHLQQYKYVDIALDPFPNGGCTTTVEALWMGVPVITLKGESYVSRMSTAVLMGANLKEWVASDLDSYIKLALDNAANLTPLRYSRNSWREKLNASELGDSKGLIRALESSFTQMHASS